jgi:phosphatidylserine/phosphatidylglycerophosphate/cardiolipin synthase-like enzyme
MYLKVGPDHKIYKRRAISGWNKVRYQHPNLVLYVDATMLYDGSILAVHSSGDLHLLATASAPPDVVAHTPGTVVAVTTLLDNSVLVLNQDGTVWRARSPHGRWQPVDDVPPGLILVDVTTSPDGRVHFLGKDGSLVMCRAPGVPTNNWAPFPQMPPRGTTRVEILHDGSMIAVDAQGELHLFTTEQLWTALQDCGPVLSLTQLGGHTLLAIDRHDKQFMTADALPENWQPVIGPAHEVLAIGHLKSGHIAALCTDSVVYQASYTLDAFPGNAADWQPLTTMNAPEPLVGMTVTHDGVMIAVDKGGAVYKHEKAVLKQQQTGWFPIDTGDRRVRAVTILEDGATLIAIADDGPKRLRLLGRLVTTPNAPPWIVLGEDEPVTISLSTAKDGSLLEVDGHGGLRRRWHPKEKKGFVFSCGWAGRCVQVIELATVPGDTEPRARRWLLQYSAQEQKSVYGGGRPWGDGTKMAKRAEHGREPWDVGNRVTPLIGGYAALSAIRDAFGAAILDAQQQERRGVEPGERGHVYIVDWLLNALRDLSDENPWGGDPWQQGQNADPDQTALGLIARMMAAGIKVKVLVWMPTSIQAKFAAGHARQHWHLASAIQDLNTRLCGQGDLWQKADPIGVCALDLRTADVSSASLHQKMVVVRVGDVNVGFCGGVDLAFTRRDYGRPANQIIGLGDWQSGHHIPIIQNGWPLQHQSLLTGYRFVKRNDEDDFEDELGDAVYGSGTGPRGEYRHWHDQHLKLEGPIVATLEEQFDERWRLPGRVFTFARSESYGMDNQVIFTSDKVFTPSGDGAIHPLVIKPCAPVGDAVVQLWRTIPIDARRQNRSPFGRGEFTVMAGVSKAVCTAKQLITIWDQYFWSEPLSKLLAHRLKTEPGLHLLIVLPPHGSNNPVNELWYRRRAMQTLWNALTRSERQRVLALNAWSAAKQTGVYVHAKVQTYDDCLIVCGSANMNRRSFACDMELDCAFLHNPSVQYHLANLAHMALGHPWADFGSNWLKAFWKAMKASLRHTMIPEPFFKDEGEFEFATPSGVPYEPGGYTPERLFEPTTLVLAAEDVGSDKVPGSPGPAGRLDQIVYLTEKYAKEGAFPYRQAK